MGDLVGITHPMLDALRNFTGNILTSPEPAEPGALRRSEAITLSAVAAVIVAWLFTFHLRRFLGLGTASDLYANVQLATSWLEGRFLHDNYFGNYLGVHTYFLSPGLAIFAAPFGAPGLLFAESLAAGLGLVAMVKILRLLGVGFRGALAGAIFATVMPLSLQVYQVDDCGFQLEVLQPALALWLGYFLLRRHRAGALLCGGALLAAKEDVGLLVMAVAVLVLAEDFLRRLAGGGWREAVRTLNRPALTLIALSLVAMPVLLAIVKSQPVEAYSNHGSFARVHSVDGEAVSGLDSLVHYFATNLGVWLQSVPVSKWLACALAGTAGLVLLRPHLLVLGLATTLTAWLVQGDLLWSPRLAPALALIQLGGCLALASACRQMRKDPRRAFAWGAALALAVAAGLYGQHRLAPTTSECYRLAPALEVSAADRRKADELFAIYRRTGRRDEPVVASAFLFRYVHDRDFYWISRLRTVPVWILWDQAETPLAQLELYLKTDAHRVLADYELVGQAGRFLLYRSWHGREPADGAATPPIAGEPYGLVRLKLQPAAGRAGTSEPLLAIGPARRGELFFVHYLDDRRLQLGYDSLRQSAQLSEPVEYAAGSTYEVELFSGSLLPPAGGAAVEETKRLGYLNFVSARWAGREILNTLAPSRTIGPDEVRAGVNGVRSARATARFSGGITDVRRGGYPPAPASGSYQEFGAVRMTVQLPATGTGAAEPLVVVGVAGEATLGYVRVFPDGKFKVGAEFWSFGAFESEPLAADPAKPVEIVFSCPVFFPPVDDLRWRGAAAELRGQRRSRLTITVEGAVVLDRPIPAPVPRQPTVAYGKNPVGGSVVQPAFTGQILRVSREPLARP